EGTTGSAVHLGTLGAIRAHLSLPAGAGKDRLRLRALVTLAGGSDGIDPAADGFSLDLDGATFDLPPSGFITRHDGWPYRDPGAQASTPDGISRAVLRRQHDGTFKLTVTGHNLELSRYDGTNDRTIALAVESGNDRAAGNATLHRTNHDLRTP